MSKQQPIHNYISFEDLYEKAGYRKFKPKIGALGQALIKFSKENRQVDWLKKMLDVYFQNQRQKYKERFKHNEQKNKNRRKDF